jgi:hypothetical protein
LFRSAKLRLNDVPGEVTDDASRPGGRLVDSLGLTDAKGQPRCARVPPLDITWSSERA